MTHSHQLAFQVHAGKGPYLGLVHGFLSSSAQWMLNLEALSKVCTPVTIDLWGHGESEAPADANFYTPAAYIEEFDKIRRRLGCSQWFMCGYSLGAGLTIRYAHDNPEHVHAHLLTNSQSAFASEKTLKMWREDMPTTTAKIREQGASAIKRIAVHPRFAKRLPAPVFEALNQDAAKLSPNAVAHTLETTNLSVSVRDIAATNPRPAQLCFGKHEQRFQEAKTWACENMANLSVIELDAGHGVNMEDAQGFNSEVTRFLTAHM